MTVGGSHPLNDKVLADSLRRDTWKVHRVGPHRLRIDDIQGVNIEPICDIAIETAASHIEVNARYPRVIPVEMYAAVTNFMNSVATAINPVQWHLDHIHGRLTLSYTIEVQLPDTHSAKLVSQWETKRKLRVWVQRCIDTLDRYSCGLNAILAGKSLEDVKREMERAAQDDARFEEPWERSQD